MIQDFYILSSARKSPKYLVIILHGYGANGKNLLSMAQYWKNILKDTLFIVPNAPFPFPHDENGYQWFEIGDLSPSYLMQGCQMAAPLLHTFITNIQNSYSTPPQRTILTGFSQGGMLALATGLAYEHTCQGILSYSGGLFLLPSLLSPSSHKVHIGLIHGTEDSVVPHQASIEAKQRLINNQNNVIFHSMPHLGHQINEEGLKHGAQFIQRSLV
ncbi:MAG: alpha/beta hydrolase [Alphaproteobacteria bacterium]